MTLLPLPSPGSTSGTGNGGVTVSSLKFLSDTPSSFTLFPCYSIGPSYLWAAGEYLFQHLEHLFPSFFCDVGLFLTPFSSFFTLFVQYISFRYFFSEAPPTSLMGSILAAVGLLQRCLELEHRAAPDFFLQRPPLQPLTLTNLKIYNRWNKQSLFFVWSQELSHSCFFPISSPILLKECGATKKLGVGLAVSQD